MQSWRCAAVRCVLLHLLEGCEVGATSSCQARCGVGGWGGLGFFWRPPCDALDFGGALWLGGQRAPVALRC